MSTEHQQREQAAQIAEMRRRGMTYDQIGATLGLHTKAVSRRLLRYYPHLTGAAMEAERQRRAAQRSHQPRPQPSAAERYAANRRRAEEVERRQRIYHLSQTLIGLSVGSREWWQLEHELRRLDGRSGYEDGPDPEYT